MSLRTRLFLVVLGGLIFGLFQLSATGQTLDLVGLDWFRTRHAPRPEIMIVAIDTESLQRVGRWPWSRSTQATLIERLVAAKPALIGLDILLATPESAEADGRLVTAVRNSDVPVVLAAEAVFTRGSATPSELVLPLAPLRELPGARVGHINVPVESDGVARRFPIPLGDSRETVEPFAAELVGLRSTTDPVLADLAGPGGTFPTVPAWGVLDGSVPSELLADKILLVGATASSLHDTVLVPADPPVMAGVEWQATLLDTLLTGAGRWLVPRWFVLLLGFALLVGTFLVMTRARPSRLSAGLVIAALLLPATSLVLWHARIALPYLGLLATTLTLLIGHTVYRWYAAEAEKRRLRATFAPYFSPAVLRAILSDPHGVHWGGERRDVTILFSDIRNFTTISESIPPERLTALLREYFTAMDEAISATDGVLSEFVGDGIVAFWGAPIDQPDHADRALRTAFAMFDRLAPLREQWLAQGYPVITIGVGINSGPAIVGNTGSVRRFDYAAIGDTTNVASRLEGLNKQFGTSIVVSAETKRRLTIPVATRSLGRVPLKGKTKPVAVYAVEPPPSRPSAPRRRALGDATAAGGRGRRGGHRAGAGR